VHQWQAKNSTILLWIKKKKKLIMKSKCSLRDSKCINGRQKIAPSFYGLKKKEINYEIKVFFERLLTTWVSALTSVIMKKRHYVLYIQLSLVRFELQ